MKRILLLFIGVVLSVCGFSKTVDWGITPVYDDLKPYAAGVYYCSKGGKWGLVNTSGEVLMQPKYDFITPMIDGFALAGSVEGSKNRIECIVNSTYNTVDVLDEFYVVNKYYTYFSEDKLPVANRAGKQGFINSSGEVVVKCQFDNVHPFSNGYASVSKYPYAYYITERYDSNPSRSMLPIEFNYGEITFATTFHNGRAVVAYNGKSAVINTSGKKVGKYKGKINETCYNKFDYTIKGCGSEEKDGTYNPPVSRTIEPYFENGLYGYRQNGEIIVYPSFSKAGVTIDREYAVVTFDGKVGLLHFVDGEITSFIAKKNGSSPLTGAMSATSKGTVSRCDYVLNVPSQTNESYYSVSIDRGDGTVEAMDRHGSMRVSFLPLLAARKAKSVTITAIVKYFGITVHRFQQTFELSYAGGLGGGNGLRISVIATQTERANDKDVQVVRAVVSNGGADDVVVTATLSIPSKSLNSKTKLTIPASGSRNITLSVHDVLKTETVEAKVTLSTGESTTKQITLKPYY
jgi:hypothetical protein